MHQLDVHSVLPFDVEAAQALVLHVFQYAHARMMEALPEPSGLCAQCCRTMASVASLRVAQQSGQRSLDPCLILQ